MHSMSDSSLLYLAISAAKQASQEIMSFYQKHSAPDVMYKSDNSPVTQADTASHAAIVSILMRAGLPMVSEEGQIASNQCNQNEGSCFWLIDPLDGTKEFLSRNDQFTVNIALVRDGAVVLGVVAEPATDVIYFALKGQGAHRIKRHVSERIFCSSQSTLSKAKIAVSRSHLNAKDQQFIETHDINKTIPLGSALKYCHIATGEVDLSIRHTPLMPWDLAASDLVVSEAGGMVCDFDKHPYSYTYQSCSEPLTKGLIVSNHHLVIKVEKNCD